MPPPVGARARSRAAVNERRRARAPRIGVGAVIWRADAVLLVRRGRPPRLGEWSLPGGRQRWGETVEAALRREVREETGLGLGPLTLVDVVDLLDRDREGRVEHHYTLIDFTAEAAAGEPVAGDDAAAVAWFAPSDLDRVHLWATTRAVIRRAVDVRPRPSQSASDF